MADLATGRPAARLDRALIVDDHPLFCEALAMTRRTALGVSAVATAPDVVLLDLKLPDVDGLDGLIRLRRTAGSVPVVGQRRDDDDRHAPRRAPEPDEPVEPVHVRELEVE